MASQPMFFMFTDQTPTNTTTTTTTTTTTKQHNTKASDHDHNKPTRSGRKHNNCKKQYQTAAPKKKKVPQRGVGVAQLERLISTQQETLKKMTSAHVPDPVNLLPVSTNAKRNYFGDHEGGFDPGMVVNGPSQVSVDPNWPVGSNNNMFANVMNSHLCNFQKKYPNYQAMYNTTPPSLSKNSDFQGFFGTSTTTMTKDVNPNSFTNEMGKKKGISSTNSSSLLEYEFFPGKSGTSIKEEKFSVAADSEASFVHATTSGYRATNSTSIDLSLKL
ncbi:hypothetical protein ACFE04_006711 [Oxalis oulophora]